MNCHDIKNMISAYIDGELDDRERHLINEHLAACRSCRMEVDAQEKVWQMLGEYEGIEPDPDYAARFWNGVKNRPSWREKIRSVIWPDELRLRWVPVLASACAVVLFSAIAIRNHFSVPVLNDDVASLSQIDLDMVASVEILEDYEIIEDIDFYSDLEFIERLDQTGAS